MLKASGPGRMLGWERGQKQDGWGPFLLPGHAGLVFLYWRHMPGGLWLGYDLKDDRWGLDMAPSLGLGTEKR